jgi:hypothetical protein
LALTFVQLNCWGADGTSFELWSAEKVKMGRLGVQWSWDNRWFQDGKYHLGGYWDASLSYWEGSYHRWTPNSTQNLNDLGVAAVFRYQKHDRTGFYAEAGTGPRYMSEYYDNNFKRQGSKFVFNTHLGVGFAWKNGLDLGFKAMHMSNGGVAEPNPAVNVLGVGLKYRW